MHFLLAVVRRSLGGRVAFVVAMAFTVASSGIRAQGFVDEKGVGSQFKAVVSFVNTAASGEDQNTSCAGPLAQKVWQRWDDSGRDGAMQLLQTRLLDTGDTYVLYDLQTQLHNLLAMAQRCGETERVRQLSVLVQTAYSRLELDAVGSTRRQWVCRGGSVCNTTNRLVNTEVMLTSVQFLVFATHMADALHSQPAPSAEDRAFAQQTARVAVEHLLRWGDVRAVQALQDNLDVRPQDVRDGSSRYFLTDKVLWQLTLYARLAGMAQRDKSLAQGLALSVEQWRQLRTHAQALSALVQRRIQLTTAKSEKGMVMLSDLDVGYWRLYKDNRYAAYEGTDPPAVCEQDAQGKRRVVLKIAPTLVPVRDDIGWDISHARRLVHYLAAIQAYHQDINTVWQVPTTVLPSAAVMQGFAQQLYSRAWNQDAQHPLFSNYLSGANGWYRVAYDNGTGRCSEGYPPYGLTDAFTTGGYATWGAMLPQLRDLAWRLYQMAESKEPNDRAFIARYYRGLSDAASPNVRLFQQLMFWPSLIAQP